jgi:hypothetical protein
MTLLGLMVAGAFAASLLGEQSSRLTQTDALLGAAADYAITTVLGDPRANRLADLPFGQPRSFDVTVPDAASVRATVVVTRLSAGVLWLVVDATVGGVDQGHRRTNVIARFPSPGALPPAAIVARGNVVARDSVSFGVDSTGDPDCAVASTLDVITPSGATVDAGDSTRIGALGVAGDSATYYMKARQTAMLDSAATVVHVRGDTTIAGGTFSGILLVDGSITVTGPFAVTGLIIARGSISATAGGLATTGAIMAYGNPTRGGVAVEITNATIRYAPCAVASALKHALAPKPVPQRSWAELF